MSNTIKVKMLNENALMHMRTNINTITKKIQTNEDNSWIYNEFPQPLFIEKKFEFNDFELENNPESADKSVDFDNSIKIYEAFKNLPQYILCDEKFWLWLYLDKFYQIVRKMIKIRSSTTIENMWMQTQGARRGLMFGVLSRMYFRVALSIDESKGEDKYELTKWVCENPLRFRNLTWRSYSSEAHIVRGALKGEKRAVEDSKKIENNDIYPIIGKFVSEIGSVRLLDTISEGDIENIVYKKCLSLLNDSGNDK